MKGLYLVCAALAALTPPAAAGGFPVCFYGVSEPASLAVLRNSGFNCFQTYLDEPEKLAGLAEAARGLDMRMVAPPYKVMESVHADRARKWPVLAWYLKDEPEVSWTKPEELLAMDARVKAWSPEQPTAFVMGHGFPSFTYGAAADAVMVDWYPVPHLPLESVGRELALAREGVRATDPARPEKPLWAVLQALDWREYPQRRKERVGGWPTFEQVRFMTWLAVARGAAGVFYFKYSDNKGVPLPQRPELWSRYTRVAAELNAMSKVLVKGKDIPLPEGLDGRLTGRGLKRWWRKYAIVLNPTAGAVPLNAEALEGWRPLFETRRDLPESLPPYGVLILEK
ncbi:MAG TPA: hypothetical protein PK875_00600 [Spirochaetota bacterium]|nr:hypothetical protein [Spirochaetota bacterium]